jgi:multidrug resistance efflux pump
MAEEIKHQDKELAEKEMAHHAHRRRVMVIMGLVVAFAVVLGGGAYWYVSSRTVYIDQSVISGTLINLSPQNAGILNQIFVNVGDEVVEDQPVARVGDEVVEAKTAGIVTAVSDDVGQLVSPDAGSYVVQMIDPSDLRVVGHLDENKGLSKIAVGDPATFTVDAFGSKSYQGVVDEISETSRASDVVFDVSDERPTNEFDVKVRFDPEKYPELKNGMSAKIWVYVK